MRGGWLGPAAVAVAAAAVLSGCALDQTRGQHHQRQDAVRREVRRLPHPRTRQRDRRRRAQPRRGVPARRAGRLQAARRSRASSTGRSSTRPACRRSTRSPGKEVAAMPANLVDGHGRRGRRGLRRPGGGRPGQDTGRLATIGTGPVERRREGQGRHARHPDGPERRARLQVRLRRGARGHADRRVEERRERRPRHRDRGQRRQREGRGRQERRRLAVRGRPSSPASTPSTAPCPAIARAAWRAPSPSSRRRARLSSRARSPSPRRPARRRARPRRGRAAARRARRSTRARRP